MTKLEYSTWLEVNEEELSVIAAETGADREYDFDFDRWAENLYDEGDKNNTLIFEV